MTDGVRVVFEVGPGLAQQFGRVLGAGGRNGLVFAARGHEHGQLLVRGERDVCRCDGARDSVPCISRDRFVDQLGIGVARLPVRFFGTEECRPCYWMDGALGPGAHAWLRGRGGLRARILSDGWLARTPVASAAPGPA